MRRKRNNLRPLIIWLLIVAIVQAGIIGVLIHNSSTSIEVFIWLTAGAIPLLQIFYQQMQKSSLRFFLFTQRILSLFTDRVLTWTLVVEYIGEFDKEMLDEITRALLEANRQTREINVRKINLYARQIELASGPTLDVVFNTPDVSPVMELDAAKKPYIQVSIRNYRVGFRGTEHVINTEIMPILEVVSHVVGNEVDSKYNLTINFEKGNNPFYGLYLAQFDPKSIVSFSVKLALNDYGFESTVYISDTKVYISTHSQNAIRNLALEFLTYDSNLRGRLRNA